jgi:hypothetical protein
VHDCVIDGLSHGNKQLAIVVFFHVKLGAHIVDELFGNVDVFQNGRKLESAVYGCHIELLVA